MSNNILVTGPTGKIGAHLVKLLTEAKQAVTVYTRDKAKAHQSFGETVKYAEGDLHQLDRFDAAVKGQDRLVLITNESLHEVTLVQRALAAGVKHIVKISCWHASTSADLGTVFQEQGAAEQAILALKAPVTFLRPSDFNQNLLASAASIKGQSAFIGSWGDAAVPSIDARDIAATAAKVLTDAIADWVGRGFTITGPEALTASERAKILSEVLGKPIAYHNLDDASYFKAMTGYVGRQYALLLTTLSTEYRLRNTNQRWTTGYVELITGKKPRSFREFVQDHKAAFQ